MPADKPRFAWSQRDVRRDFHNFVLGGVTALVAGLFWAQISQSGGPSSAPPRPIAPVSVVTADAAAIEALRADVASLRAALAATQARPVSSPGAEAGAAAEADVERVRVQVAELALRLVQQGDAAALMQTRLTSLEAGLAAARADLDAPAGPVGAHAHPELEARIAAAARASAAPSSTAPAAPPTGAAPYIGTVSFLPNTDASAFTSSARFVALSKLSNLPGASRMSCAPINLDARPKEETFVCLLLSEETQS